MFKLILFFFIFSQITLFCQFSLDQFFLISFDKSKENEIEKYYINKEFIENEIGSYKGISFFDSLAENKIKVTFMFSSAELVIGKAISNQNKETKDSERLFNYLNVILIKKYGKEFSENSIAGNKMLVWNQPNSSITLSLLKNLCIFSIMKK